MLTQPRKHATEAVAATEAKANPLNASNAFGVPFGGALQTRLVYFSAGCGHVAIRSRSAIFAEIAVLS